MRLCWAQFLPEIGEPLLAEMARIKDLERQAFEARKAVMDTIYGKWSRAEILAAKRASNVIRPVAIKKSMLLTS